MGVRSQLTSLGSVPSTIPAQVLCLLGTCALGTPGTSYSFDPGDDVISVLGPGKATQAASYILRQPGARRVVVVPTVGTYPALPSVTQTGTGPTCTVGLTPGNPVGGCFDDYPLSVTCTAGGAPGVAQVSIAYDGSTVAETRTIPGPTPGAIVGTSAITPNVLAMDDATPGATLGFTEPSSATATLAQAPSLAGGALHAATATSLSPVTVTGSSLLAPGVAALAANPRMIGFTTAGSTPAHVPATATIAGTDYTGAVIGEVVTLSTTAGTAGATLVYASIASIAYTSGGGTDATVAIVYAEAYASPAELVSAIQAALVASPVALTASLVEQVDGVHLGLVCQVADGSTSVEMGAPTPLSTLLGFTANQLGAGAHGVLALPNTGVSLTFTSTTAAKVGTTWSIPLQGPRSSVSALATAATAARTNFLTAPFGVLVQVEDSSSHANAALVLSTLDGLRASWNADTHAPVFTPFLVQSALHVASPNAVTNAANIATSDAAFVAAFPPSTPGSVFSSVAHGDLYITGASGLPAGTFRRPNGWAGAAKISTATKIAANPADGGIGGGASMRGPDGLTLARNENTSPVKLGGLSGIGAWVCADAGSLNAPTFAVCATRAGASNRLREPGAVFIGEALQAVLFPVYRGWVGQGWAGSPTKPVQISDAQAASAANVVQQIAQGLCCPPGAPANISGVPAAAVTGPNTGNDGQVWATVTYNPLIVVEDVNVTIGAAGFALS